MKIFRVPNFQIFSFNVTLNIYWNFYWPRKKLNDDSQSVLNDFLWLFNFTKFFKKFHCVFLFFVLIFWHFSINPTKNVKKLFFRFLIDNCKRQTRRKEEQVGWLFITIPKNTRCSHAHHIRILQCFSEKVDSSILKKIAKKKSFIVFDVFMKDSCNSKSKKV